MNWHLRIVLMLLGALFTMAMMSAPITGMSLIEPVLVVGLCYFCGREIVVSRQAAQQWREKWPDLKSSELPARSLLRGAEAPTMPQSEVLLRATQQQQETPKEELLRVSQK
jgi:hypothetical protein